MSLQTTVLGIKDFSCGYTCVSCSNSLETYTYEECDLIECPRCSAQFLRDHASLVCKCLLLLNNKQWFKANTAVSKTLTTGF